MLISHYSAFLSAYQHLKNLEYPLKKKKNSEWEWFPDCQLTEVSAHLKPVIDSF